MPNATNEDLHIMLVRIEERQIFVVEKLDTIVARQKEHEEKDDKRFDSLNKYATSVGIVAGSIGWGIAYAWKKITG